MAGFPGQLFGNCDNGHVPSGLARRINMTTIHTKSENRRVWYAFLSVSLMILSAPNQLQAADSIKGSPENGQAIAEKKCDRCHGSGGVSDDPDTPHLAAQSANYLLKQMVDYKSGLRADKNMYKRVRNLDEQQMADIALWYESQILPEDKALAMQELKVPQLVDKGDPDRSIPPCEICHGKDGKTTAGEIPKLAGQHADYLVSTMEYFRDGSRSNDTAGFVQTIIKKLSDVEIEELARYYAALGGTPAE
jgi:cytochrome c553